MGDESKTRHRFFSLCGGETPHEALASFSLFCFKSLLKTCPRRGSKTYVMLDTPLTSAIEGSHHKALVAMYSTPRVCLPAEQRVGGGKFEDRRWSVSGFWSSRSGCEAWAISALNFLLDRTGGHFRSEKLDHGMDHALTSQARPPNTCHLRP